MVCEKCGRVITEGSRFCEFCGTAVMSTRMGHNYYMSAGSDGADKGKAITSMALGISSLILFYVFFLSIPCAIVGLILGKKVGSGCSLRGMAKAGVICSIIGLSISPFGIALWAAIMESAL